MFDMMSDCEPLMSRHGETFGRRVFELDCQFSVHFRRDVLVCQGGERYSHKCSSILVAIWGVSFAQQVVCVCINEQQTGLLSLTLLLLWQVIFGTRHFSEGAIRKRSLEKLKLQEQEHIRQRGEKRRGWKVRVYVRDCLIFLRFVTLPHAK